MARHVNVYHRKLPCLRIQIHFTVAKLAASNIICLDVFGPSIHIRGLVRFQGGQVKPHFITLRAFTTCLEYSFVGSRGQAAVFEFSNPPWICSHRTRSFVLCRLQHGMFRPRCLENRLTFFVM